MQDTPPHPLETSGIVPFKGTLLNLYLPDRELAVTSELVCVTRGDSCEHFRDFKTYNPECHIWHIWPGGGFTGDLEPAGEPKMITFGQKCKKCNLTRRPGA